MSPGETVRSASFRWPRFLLLWLLCVLLAAAANVPLAVTRLRSRTTPKPGVAITRTGADIPAAWPGATPHAQAWPKPESWSEWRAWGYAEFDVRVSSTVKGRNGFSMEVHHAGWPLPVLEAKQMWWDWNDPALKGPEPDPRLAVLLSGLVLNPLIVGTGGFVGVAAVLIAVPFAFESRRNQRRKRGSCLHCGYLLRTPAPNCPECGTPVELPRIVER